MKRVQRIPRVVTAAALVGLTSLAALAPIAGLAPLAHADGYVPITGAGSTWSQVAIDAWRADVRANGLVVNYSGTGSSDGRAEYIQHTVDFAVSEIPFENPPEPGQQAEIPDRPYAYLPIVAGGTSFMYHLTIAGKQFRDLRLTGDTLTRIFTGHITRWNDPAIVKENGGRAMPAEAIVPVIRSDGSGASAQFSRYMLKQFSSLWCPFAHEHLGQPSGQCSLTSYYPSFGNAKSQVGSNGVANYVAASYGEGAIGYVEYAYAKRVDYPVASLLNAAGYYTQPSAGDVAVALTKARINSDLTENLDSVYTNPDPRTYPMSSYSYLIAPTTTASPFNTDKGRSLSTFVNYFLCAGQQKAQILGYSPVPANLVQAGFDQVKRIPGHIDPPALSSCNNPALRILATAPQPQSCQKATALPCDLTATATSGGATSAHAGTGTAVTPVTGGAPAAPGVRVPAGHATGSGTTSTATGAVPTGNPSAVTAAAVQVAVSAGAPSDARDTVLAILAVVAVAAAVAVPFFRTGGGSAAQ
ncbi:MAG: phosphate ABC transporter substrate-binding protein PstS [Frankiales bacterium]|nr:phosphate ABC transporter substrate-binding protein PstS [Frankiales bacterium]